MKNRHIDIPRMLMWIMENVIFIVIAGLLFFRTAEVMKAFAPNNVLGYTSDGAHTFYGYVCASAVEGLLILAKGSISGQRDDLAWFYNAILIVLTWLFSSAMQLVDGQLVRSTLASQPPLIQNLVNVGVPLVPSTILFLVLGKTMIETVPESVIAGFKTGRVARIFAPTPAGSGMRGVRVVEQDKPKLDAPQPVRQLAKDVEAVRLNGPQDMDAEQLAKMAYKEIRALFGVTWKEAQRISREAQDKVGKGR